MYRIAKRLIRIIFSPTYMAFWELVVDDHIPFGRKVDFEVVVDIHRTRRQHYLKGILGERPNVVIGGEKLRYSDVFRWRLLRVLGFQVLHFAVLHQVPGVGVVSNAHKKRPLVEQRGSLHSVDSNEEGLASRYHNAEPLELNGVLSHELAGDKLRVDLAVGAIP